MNSTYNTICTLPADTEHVRLDQYIADSTPMTRGQAKRAIEQGRVTVNDTAVQKPSHRIVSGDAVCVAEEEVVEQVVHEDIDMPIIAQTEHYVVIDKPAGLLTHPTQAHEPQSVASWFTAFDPAVSGVGDSPERPGIVHRLDKDTSGLLVLARTQKMFDHLKKQFQARTVGKEYVALVHGTVEPEHVVIDFTIDRGSDGRMVSRPKTDVLKLKNVGKEQEGKEAKTELWVEQHYINHSLLRVKIHTGRTHQIRVHMLAYDHPVVGDPLYMQKKYKSAKGQDLDRLFLHAAKLCFEDLDGKEQCFVSPMPESLQTFINTLT